MKRIILSTTSLLLLAAATHAQIINQAGAQQYANQVMNGNGQSSTIRQVQAQDNLDRTNFGNYAITYQGFPNNTGPNTALIEQNDGSQGNRAGLTQGGGNNQATIQQNGGPDGLSGGGTSSSATIGAPAGDGNFAGILQQGSNGTALLAQNNNSRQNGAEIYQNGLSGVGTRNTAVVIQANNSVNNDGFIYQGYSNQNVAGAAVTNNEAYIYQGRTYSFDGPSTASSVNNLATITQLTSNNVAGIYQGGTAKAIDSPTRQAGDSFGSTATILQQGDRTIANIYQGTLSGKAVGSRASIVQTGTLSANIIYQGAGTTGSDRASTASVTSGVLSEYNWIFQGFGGVSEENQATVQQTGKSHAQFFQGGGVGTYAANNKATAIQLGQAGSAAIYQNSITTGINDYPFQSNYGTSVGRDNTGTILQAAGLGGGAGYIDQGVIFASEPGNRRASGNTGTINQLTGSGLLAVISQASGFNRIGTAYLADPYGASKSAIKLGDIAINNVATITQAGGSFYLVAEVFQGGQGNSSTITQMGGYELRADIVQAEKTRDNLALINQNGSRNQATIYQFSNVDANNIGASNTAIINQLTGSDNIAIAQQGTAIAANPSSNNYLRITQNGTDNQARFAQVGNNNYADITQNGNGNRLVDATGTVGSYALQQGNNNRLILTQNPGSGPGLSFTYTQIGNNNTQVVTQTNAN